LSKRLIITKAIEIADEKGIGAVSLRGIANGLGVHVTSLYNHVPTKNALMDEIVSALVEKAELPTVAPSWQQWVREFALAMRAIAATHPGAFEAMHYGTAQGAIAAETFEVAIAAFRADGFDAESTYNAVKATILTVLGLITNDTAGVRNPQLRTDLTRLPSSRFPHIHEIAHVAETADTVSYLIETLIAGFRGRTTKTH
jgi:AcrR family transcriptional regulator